jgi:hypothetical protein
LFQTLGIVEDEIKKEEELPVEPGRAGLRGRLLFLPWLSVSEQSMFFELGDGHGLAVVKQLEIRRKEVRDRVSFLVHHVNLDEL